MKELVATLIFAAAMIFMLCCFTNAEPTEK